MLEEKAQDLMINMRGLLPLIISNALNVLGAILILLIGLWLAGKADQLVVRTLSRAPHFDAMLANLSRLLAVAVKWTMQIRTAGSGFEQAMDGGTFSRRRSDGGAREAIQPFRGVLSGIPQRPLCGGSAVAGHDPILGSGN